MVRQDSFTIPNAAHLLSYTEWLCLYRLLCFVGFDRSNVYSRDFHTDFAMYTGT